MLGFVQAAEAAPATEVAKPAAWTGLDAKESKPTGPPEKSKQGMPDLLGGSRAADLLGGTGIMKTLTQKIKSLELNQSLLEGYVQDMNQKLLADVDGFAAELEGTELSTQNLTAAVERLAAAHAAAEERAAAAAAALASRLRGDTAAATHTQEHLHRLQVTVMSSSELIGFVCCCLGVSIHTLGRTDEA